MEVIVRFKYQIPFSFFINLKRIVVIVALFFILIPSVLADIRAPSPGETATFWAVLLVFNYIVNFILIGIQSKIWLHLGFKKIATGLAIITPIMFVVEGVFVWVFDYFLVSFNSVSTSSLISFSAVLNFFLIFACYLFISKYYWECEKKKTIVTAVIMGIVTNPSIFFVLLMFFYLEPITIA